MKENNCVNMRTPRFIQACILLLLYESKSYGYELIENLKKRGFVETNPDAGIVYRVLRKCEKQGFVASQWLHEEKGPAKRLYELTRAGEKALREWGFMIRTKVKTLKNFLRVFNKTVSLK
ncbi:MAG: helix-turn-helix transcriptional regulator [Spirochaetales bacterium]|nr:helix-turn-helix transcriptional regulator [Spirochaetales bacterium]